MQINVNLGNMKDCKSVWMKNISLLLFFLLLSINLYKIKVDKLYLLSFSSTRLLSKKETAILSDKTHPFYQSRGSWGWQAI